MARSAEALPPYQISYLIQNAANTFSLPAFQIAIGGYVTPPGYINYGVVPAGVYSVSLTVSDASNPVNAITLPNFFQANITSLCTVAAAPTAITALVPPVVTSVITAGAPVPVPVVQPAVPVLAVTGSPNTEMALFGLLLIAVGALILGSAQLRRRKLF